MSRVTNPVLDVGTLADHISDPDWAIIDCRFDLMDIAAGERAYLSAHIAGAVYAHLERDLSGPISSTGAGGRHPLPTPERMVHVFSGLGIDSSTQVDRL